MNIKPTVGRVVWYHPNPRCAESDFAAPSGDEPLAAIIAKVHNDYCVNLTVFDANGAAHPRTSVPLVPADAYAIPEGAYCEWMPYQKGQAAKIEEVQRAATCNAGLAQGYGPGDTKLPSDSA